MHTGVRPELGGWALAQEEPMCSYVGREVTSPMHAYSVHFFGTNAIFLLFSFWFAMKLLISTEGAYVDSGRVMFSWVPIATARMFWARRLQAAGEAFCSTIFA